MPLAYLKSAICVWTLPRGLAQDFIYAIILLVVLKIIVGRIIVVEIINGMEITIRGKKYSITKEKVEKAVRNVVPERISKYSVLLHNKPYPIKQVFAATLGISPMEFGTLTAYQVLQNLGFEIVRKS